MIRRFLSFIGINIQAKQTSLVPEIEEEQLVSNPYLYQTDQTIIEEYDDVEVIGMWGCFNAETGESEIKGEMMSRTVKFTDADGSIHIDRKWYPDNS